jgi:hypothetical protein
VLAAAVKTISFVAEAHASPPSKRASHSREKRLIQSYQKVNTQMALKDSSIKSSRKLLLPSQVLLLSLQFGLDIRFSAQLVFLNSRLTSRLLISFRKMLTYPNIWTDKTPSSSLENRCHSMLTMLALTTRQRKRNRNSKFSTKR